MESFNEIKKNLITELVTKEAIDQIDEIIAKLEKAVQLQIQLNNLLFEHKRIEQI